MIKYTEKDLVKIGKRRNNTKRTYLVINQLQGKHLPVSAKHAFEMFDQLAEQIEKEYKNEKLLLIGFAETATAIGARVAAKLSVLYMQTTREKMDKVEYLFFSEAHSHATEQKLVKDDLDICINEIDRIIFIEDEVTTGNTILNIVDILKHTYGTRVQFSVASILNGMNESAEKKYNQYGIRLHYLVKTDHTHFADICNRYQEEGTYMEYKSNKEDIIYNEIEIDGFMDARRLVESKEYLYACERLWNNLKEKIGDKKDKVLVLGTEEFMFPALYVALKMEEIGMNAVFHATTRSPICVYKEAEYPVHVSNQINSLYEDSRITYVYDLKKYDRVYVITDATKKGLEKNLITAIQNVGNKDITIVRWILS